MLLGDALAQRFELEQLRAASKNNAVDHDQTRTSTIAESGQFLRWYDPSRASVIVSWAAVADVPLNIMIFSTLNRVLTPLGIPAVASLPQSFLKGVLFFIPGVIIRMPCFITYVTSCEHGVANWKEGRPVVGGQDACVSLIRHKMEQNLTDMFVNGVRFWIPYHTLAFYAIPVMYRPLTLSCVTVGWMTYLSIIQHTDEDESRP